MSIGGIFFFCLAIGLFAWLATLGKTGAKVFVGILAALLGASIFALSYLLGLGLAHPAPGQPALTPQMIRDLEEIAFVFKIMAAAPIVGYIIGLLIRRR